MEKIIIKNFGPIKEVELEIKDINVFIGSTSSGKSTVAKLIAISREFELFQTSDFEVFVNKLVHYNIEFDLKEETYIRYSNGELYWELNAKTITNNYPFKNLFYGYRDIVKKFVSDLRGVDIKNIKEGGEDAYKFLALIFNFVDFEDFLVEHHANSSDKRVKRALKLSKRIKNSQSKIKSGDHSSFLEDLQDMKELYELIYGEGGPDKVCYIPAERILLSMIAESLFGLMNHDVAIAKCIKDFGAQFESARKKLTHFSIPFLDAEYQYSNRSNLIAFSDGAKIKLGQASSGFQSIIPLVLVVEAMTSKEQSRKNCFVIEEPELNLYPTIQKELVEFIVERINKSKDKLILTTHSPYVLTSLDNLIQASNAAKAHPEQSKKVEKIVVEAKWVDFDRVACYFFENGSCRSTLDQENQTIGASNIDDVSETLGKTFDQLLELKYAHVL